MKKSEVWWANLPQPTKKRPVVILSRTAACTVRDSVTVALVTSTIRGIPVEVLLDRSDGLSKNCVVNLDTIITIPKQLLTDFITTLSPNKAQQINAAIKFALDID